MRLGRRGGFRGGKHIAQQSGAGDHQGKRHIEEEDGDEGRTGDEPMSRPAKRALCNSEQGLDDDDENGRLDADKRRLDKGQVTVQRIGDAEREHDKGAGQHEQQPSREAAQRAMQPPADIGRKLHGFGTRQQHAEIERVQERLLADPFALVHQHAMHQRDLAGRAAEGQNADPRPDGERFVEGGCGACVLRHEPLVPDSRLGRNDSAG